jgi:CxxC-x17-CxxC domain-containing protein
MAFEDKKLTCKECGNDFLFSASEQEFFAKKGFGHEPARCPDCRKKKRDQVNREMTQIKCRQCGKETKVLLDIKKNVPVYCQDCFDKIKKQTS